MTKRKLGCLISLSISVLIFGMIAWHAREVVYAAESSTQTSLQDATSTDATSTNTTSTDATSSETVSTDTASTDTTSSDTISVAAATVDTASTDTTSTDASSSDASVTQPSQISGSNWIYDVDTPLDLYGSDVSTTTEIQTVAPESSFVVTYVQDDSNLVDVMTSVLSSLDTDTIDKCSQNLTVYFLLPSDVDTSGISASSFTLGGFYSLFTIDDVSQGQINSFTLIELSLTSKTSYSSVTSLLSAWQENTEGKIVLSGLSVPSSYTLSTVFYVSALPQGTVNVPIGNTVYQFEAIPDPSAGDDGMTETYSDSQTDGYRAHVAFQLGITDISSNNTSNTTSDDSSDTASDDSSNTTSDDDSSDTASGDSTVTASETQTASTVSSSTEPDTGPATVPTAAPDDTEDQKGNAVEGELPETGEQSQGSAFGAVFFAPLLLLLMVLAERRRHY